MRHSFIKNQHTIVVVHRKNHYFCVRIYKEYETTYGVVFARLILVGLREKYGLNEKDSH